jgi:hypothetical protein
MLTEISIIFEKNMMYMRFFTTTKAIWQAYQCRYNFKMIGHFMQIFSIVKNGLFDLYVYAMLNQICYIKSNGVYFLGHPV